MYLERKTRSSPYTRFFIRNLCGGVEAKVAYFVNESEFLN